MYINIYILCDRDFLGEGASADPERDNGTDGVAEVYGETALAHLAVAQVHLSISEVLLHHEVALNHQRNAQTQSGREHSGDHGIDQGFATPPPPHPPVC